MTPFASAPSLETRQRHRTALTALREARCPFLVTGAYSLAHHTGACGRPIKDLDLVVCRRDLGRALAALASVGAQTEIAFAHWLAKAFLDGEGIDVLFASGNGEIRVDDEWFARASPGTLFGSPVRFTPVEEDIWMRSFVMERERYDGADVAHLLRACAHKLDWRHLLQRFGRHWRLLLSHLVLFGFIYPNERWRLPTSVLDTLLARLARETTSHPAMEPLCQGTLLSRVEYLTDVERDGLCDARVAPHGRLSYRDARLWTRAGVRNATRQTRRRRATMRARFQTR